MKVVETKKKNKSVLLRIALAVLAIYAVISIVNQQMVIAQKKQKLESLSAQLQTQEIQNMELKQMSESEDNESYIEMIARETLNYAKPDERVFVNVAGE